MGGLERDLNIGLIVMRGRVKVEETMVAYNKIIARDNRAERRDGRVDQRGSMRFRKVNREVKE